MRRIPIKNLKYENHDYRNRLKITVLIFMIPLTCIILRLIDLQIIHHTYYETMSHNNLLSIVPLSPQRGLIYDRNHHLIAGNKPSFNINIIPERTQHLKQTIALLQKKLMLTPNDIKLFYIRLKQHRPYQAVPLDYNLSAQEIALVMVDQYQYPGVVISHNLHRYYPYGKTTAPVVGFVGRINPNELRKLPHDAYSATNYIGKSGIEKYYENNLHGKTGAIQIETDVDGHTVKSLQTIPQQAGDNLTLSLDIALQQIAMQALGGAQGAAVAIKPDNGEILALASKPSFDPNLMMHGMSQQQYKKLFSTGKNTLFNKATQGMYAVASTIKPFLAIGSLGLHVLKPHETIMDPGWFQIPNTNHIYHDAEHAGYGKINLKQAIMVSSDTYFYRLGLELGIHRISAILHAFGFGEASGIDLPNEKLGLIPSPAWKQSKFNQPWYKGDSVLTAIGQEYMLATPLQLATAVATLAEQGHQVHPHILLPITIDKKNKTVKTSTPPQSNKSISIIPRWLDSSINNSVISTPPTEQTQHITPLLSQVTTQQWQVVQHAMQQVILNPRGTGLRFGRHPQYSVAGKTGTSQLFGRSSNEESSQLNLPEKLRNNHLFIAYAPVHNPQIAVAVIVEHKAAAAAIARKILDYYLLTEKHLEYPDAN